MSDVVAFLRAVGDGDIDAIRATLAADGSLANAVGPHPLQGGRPQALNVAIETNRRKGATKSTAAQRRTGRRPRSPSSTSRNALKRHNGSLAFLDRDWR